MAADAWVVHDKFKEYLGDGTIDMDADVFKVALFLTGSNAGTTSIDALSAVTNQHANANGYLTGGVIVAGTWVEATGTVTFDVADAVWTAASGSIVCKFACIYDDTVTTPVVDPVIASCDLENGGGSITVTDTNQLTIQINANGIFQLA